MEYESALTSTDLLAIIYPSYWHLLIILGGVAGEVVQNLGLGTGGESDGI
jgi:hypothetical protein